MNKIIIDREQLEGILRLLVDDGHMTPVGTRMIHGVLDQPPAPPSGWLWRPNTTSNRWNFTHNPMRRGYPKDALFVPVHFAAPEATWGDLHELLLSDQS